LTGKVGMFMKKILIVGVVLLICAIALFKILSRPSVMDLAQQAEVRGDHTSAMANFIQVVLEETEAFTLLDKEKVITETEQQWKALVGEYLSWITYSAPLINQNFGMAVEGIKRCTSFVENVNFITEKNPILLPRDSLAKKWFLIFARNAKNDMNVQQEFINRGLKDTVSILRVRALNGYIYHIKFLDLRTGKRTDVILYPNSTISLLVKPRPYLMIVSSEVQFTEGLSGKTWRSPEEVIPITPLEHTSVKRITVKTKVHRSK